MVTRGEPVALCRSGFLPFLSGLCQLGFSCAIFDFVSPGQGLRLNILLSEGPSMRVSRLLLAASIPWTSCNPSAGFWAELLWNIPFRPGLPASRSLQYLRRVLPQSVPKDPPTPRSLGCLAQLCQTWSPNACGNVLPARLSESLGARNGADAMPFRLGSPPSPQAMVHLEPVPSPPGPQRVLQRETVKSVFADLVCAGVASVGLACLP